MTNTLKQDGSRTIFSLSSESKELYEFIKNSDINQTITFGQLNNIAGRDVRTVAYASLTTARKMCERNDRIVFASIKGIGIRRLDDEEIPQTAQSSIDHIRRTCKRTARRLLCADTNKLSNESRQKQFAYLSQLGALAEFSKPSATKTIENRVSNTNAELPVGKVMDLFKA